MRIQIIDDDLGGVDDYEGRILALSFVTSTGVYHDWNTAESIFMEYDNDDEAVTPDVVIMDPGLKSGVGAVNVVRLLRSCNKTKGLPILLYSDLDRKDERVGACMVAGGSAYIKKNRGGANQELIDLIAKINDKRE